MLRLTCPFPVRQHTRSVWWGDFWQIWDSSLEMISRRWSESGRTSTSPVIIICRGTKYRNIKFCFFQHYESLDLDGPCQQCTAGRRKLGCIPLKLEMFRCYNNQNKRSLSISILPTSIETFFPDSDGVLTTNCFLFSITNQALQFGEKLSIFLTSLARTVSDLLQFVLLSQEGLALLLGNTLF